MAGRGGSWLEGPPLQPSPDSGSRLGLPADGPGSVARFGPRVLAFIIDSVVANLLAGLPVAFGAHLSVADRNWVVLGMFLLQEWVLDTVAGQTLGKRLLHMRLVRFGSGPVVLWMLLRTVLLGLFVPAVLMDRDRRGLHDRAAGTALLMSGGPAPKF